MPERKIIYLPGGPQNVAGIAQQMPGQDQTRAIPVQRRAVTLAKQAPGVLAREGGVLANAAALTQGDVSRAEGLSQFGREAASALGEIGDQITKAWESSELAKAEVAMQEAEAAFHANAPMDPRDWGDQWQSISQSVRDKLLGDEKRLTPNLKAKLELNFQAWDSGARSSLAGRARAHTVALTKENFRTSYEYAQSRRDTKGMAELMGAMVGAGIISPESAKMRLQMDGEAIQTAVDWEDAYNDPFTAHEALNAGRYDNMLPGDKFKLSKMIEGRKLEVRRDQFRTAQDLITAHPEWTESQFMNGVYENAPNLDPADWEALNKHRLDTMKPDPAKINEMYGRAMQFTERTPPDELAKFEYEVRREIPSFYQGNILNALGGSVSGRNETFKANLRHGAANIDKHFADMEAGLKARGLRVSEVDMQRGKAEAIDALTSWLTTHPDATTQEIDQVTLDIGIPPEAKTRQEEEKRRNDAVIDAAFPLIKPTPRYLEKQAKSAQAWQDSLTN